MFTYKRTAQYHETDKMGVIHHSNYVKWMEEARVAFLESIGAGYKSVEAAGVVSPVVSVSVDYVRPVEFSDETEISLSVTKYSGAVLEFGYRFFNVTKNELCAKASSRHCFLKNGRIVSLKKELPSLSEKLDRALDGAGGE